jgi:PAS domain S-box-containing protein
MIIMESTQELKHRIEALEKEITELQAAAERVEEEAKVLAYRESETIFKTIFESSRLGNKIINRDLVITEVNSALVNLLGYSSKDSLIGAKIMDFSPENRKQDWMALQAKLWGHAMPSFSIETCLIRKDGEIIWCQVTSILFSNKGETLGYTIIEDITEKRNLRLQKEQFISIASHELKTPITSLKGITQLMNRLMKAEAQIPERLLKLGRDSDRQITKLIHLVDDLLSSTRLEQGQLSLNKSLLKVSEITDSCCSNIRLNDRYELKIQGDAELEIFADEHKIEQVLVNLVNNAVKYAPNSNTIIISVEKIGGYSKVAVIDQGDGIPKENLSKLFDRYYRANQTSSISGLGLGLYISSEIIKRHGGEIGVESNVGSGSTFWFTLPDMLEEREKLSAGGR